MQILPEEITSPLERINQVYFSDQGRMLELAPGECLVRQGEECRRIYLVKEGMLVAYHITESFDGVDLPMDSDKRGYEVFRAGVGSYVCVQAFLSRTFRSSNYIVALEHTKLCYISDTTEMIDEETYGPLERQFMPVAVHELAVRNSRIFTHMEEKEEAMRLLQRAEMAGTLAQLTAGIAHELNNAVGVLSRRSEFIADNLWNYLEDTDKYHAQLFRAGVDDTSYSSAHDLRASSRHYEKEYKMTQEAAKVLAHMCPDTAAVSKLPSRLIKAVRKNYRFWELGHDLRDMKMAAKLATGIVRSVKLLGGGNTTRENGTDVVQSIKDALNLLHNNMKHITVHTDFGELPPICADISELVQVWTNIIKNAYDAMNQAETPSPVICIITDVQHVAKQLSVLPQEYIVVTIVNNGPPIAPEHIDKIFQPNFTTKKKGMDFGLGLGLSIVRRIIDSYSGTIEVRSSENETAFIINIPTTQIHGND